MRSSKGYTEACNQLYSIASSQLGRIVVGLLNDVDDVTSLEGKLGQTDREKGTSDKISDRRPTYHHHHRLSIPLPSVNPRDIPAYYFGNN